jgi:hypothetical protein
MTKGRNQHVVPRGGGWAVKPEGGQRASSIHGTQREAIDRGREVSRNRRSELFVHGRDGRIRERDSHGHDPNPPKGRSLAGPHGAGPRKHRSMRNDRCNERTADGFGTLSFGGRHATV